MVRRTLRLAGGDEASTQALADRFVRVRKDLGVPEAFPPEVLVAAEEAAARPPSSGEEGDLRDIPFVTVDPPGSIDLDQALFLARRGAGYHVDYAIADVPAFVRPGSALDAEARRRGQTLYAPDRRVPLHPAVLSEDAASLLPGQDRSAFVWRFDLDAEGRVERTELVRARVRSRRRLDYAQVQQAADAGPPAGDAGDLVGQATLLREIGTRRLAQEQARGGASLPLPEQQIDAEDGHYRLSLRPALPAEDWNAQLSLMTGMAAAELMLHAGVGLLRTMPAPDPQLLERFRRQAEALGVHWPADVRYGDLLRGLDRRNPHHLALMHEAGALFRGAGYTVLGTPTTGAGDQRAATMHAAVAAPYAHVTAPLRRLVDRFGLVVAHAVATGGPVPDWVPAALPHLPAAMTLSDGLAGRLERACTDLVEAAVLAPRVGQSFPAVVVERRRESVKVQLLDPPVLATAAGAGELGEPCTVRLAAVDVEAGTVSFVVE